MKFDEHQCIFLHIPKTAGTSIENCLNAGKRDLRVKNAHVTQLDSMFGFYRPKNMYLQHATAEFFKSMVGDEVFENYYKFTIVRNPFDRIRSVFDYGNQTNFEEFIYDLPDLVAHPLYQWGSHFSPQYKYTNIGDEVVCDDIFRFETLQEAFAVLAGRLGIDRPLPHDNPAPKKSTPTFTTKMVEVIRHVYARDFEQFGYSTNP